mgnify:CR=1 FL=1
MGKEENTWKPIDSAPKNRMILLWDGSRQFVGKWGYTAKQGNRRGFIISDSITSDGTVLVVEATMWRERPEDPEPAWIVNEQHCRKNLQFLEALASLGPKNRITREAWLGKNIWIFRFPEDTFLGFRRIRGFLAMKTEDNEVSAGWIPSPEELNAMDWMVFDD